MEDEEKTREELIRELKELRDWLRSLETQGGIDERQPPEHIGNGQDSTETIDLSNLFHKDITSSGSFDIRGDIWATTFGRVLQAVPIPVLLVDESYKVTVANEACGRISRDYESVAGSPFRSLFPNGLAESEIQALAEKVFVDRKPCVREAVLRISEGTMWGRMTLRSIRIMTERLLLVLIEDLTAEKRQLLVNRKQQEALRREIAERQLSQKALEESELRFRQIYESAPMMMQTVDARGIIRNVNSKWSKDMGYSRDEVVGRSIGSLFDEQSQKTIAPALEGLWRKKEIRDVHLHCLRKDGQTMEVLLDAVVTEDPTWGTVGLATIRDVTHQMVLEQQLREAQKMEAIGTLAGGIAHDFNNLLQIVLGFADLLVMRTDSAAPEYRALHSIREAARRGSDLVNQILTFSRKVPTSPRPVNLNQVVENSVKLLSRTIPKMVSIKLELQEDLRPIFADPGQIEQVLMNLLINAKDAMPEGGRVTVSTHHATLDERYCRVYPEVQPGEYVVLTVSDTGHGMEKDVVDRIFEPFFTTKRPGEGTGLGLATVFGIVKSHGGHIVCRSLPGVGTTFEVFFPAMDLEITSSGAATSEFPAFGTERILLVDDEELIRNFGSEVLGKVGYTVLTAADGEEALEIYRSHRGTIDLVILDFVMPGMGGKQCLEELLKMDPEVRVLIASGYLMDQHTKAFLEQRAKGAVKKPFKVSDLLCAVRGVLDKD